MDGLSPLRGAVVEAWDGGRDGGDGVCDHEGQEGGEEKEEDGGA